MIELFLLYLVKVAIGSGVMYLCYYIFFKNDTFYNRNRLILILAILLPIVIPAINFSRLFTNPADGPGYVVEAQSLVATSYYIENAISNTIQRIKFVDILFYIYLLGLFISIIKFFRGAFSIHNLLKICDSVNSNESLFTIDDKSIPPFSYFKKIIIPRELLENSECSDIIMHEKAHVRQRHYIDLFLSEIFIAFLWFNPFAWLIRKSIKENHEYLADNEVTSKYPDNNNYQLSLLNVGGISQDLPLIHNFNKRIITKRLFMMNRNKTKPGARTKNIFVIPTIIILLFTITASSYTIVTLKKDKSPLSEVSQAGIMEYIQRNINYPQSAALANVQGEVYVDLTISKGELKSLKIYSDPDDVSAPIIDDVVINAFKPDEESLKIEKSLDEYRMDLEKAGRRIGEQLIGLDVAEWHSKKIEFAIKLDFRLTQNIASIVNEKHAFGSNNLTRTDIEAIKEGRNPLYILNGKIVSLDEFKKSNFSGNSGYGSNSKYESPLFGEKSKDGFSMRITKDALDNRPLKEYLKEYDNNNYKYLFATYGGIVTREELNDYDMESRFSRVLITVKGKDAIDIFGDKAKDGVVFIQAGRLPAKK